MMKRDFTNWEKRDQKSQRTRKARPAQIMDGVPQTLCIDFLNLMTCCRYAESLLESVRVKKYLMKYHPCELNQIEGLLAEIKDCFNSAMRY
jgi:hypothetical protein